MSHDGVQPEYTSFESIGSCPLCDATRRRIVDRDACVVRCLGCTHRYVDPRPTQEEIVRGYSAVDAYDAWLGESVDRDAMWARRASRVLDGVPIGRLLDVSAGVGTFLALARERGWEVDGTEVSTTAIEHARRLHGVEIRLGNIEDANPSRSV